MWGLRCFWPMMVIGPHSQVPNLHQTSCASQGSRAEHPSSGQIYKGVVGAQFLYLVSSFFMYLLYYSSPSSTLLHVAYMSFTSLACSQSIFSCTATMSTIDSSYSLSSTIDSMLDSSDGHPDTGGMEQKPYDGHSASKDFEKVPLQRISSQCANPDKIHRRLQQIFRTTNFDCKWKSGGWEITNAPALSSKDRARLQ